MSGDGKYILAACLLGIDVTELYSPERVNAVCSEFGLERGSSFDLRTGWDFNLEEHRRKGVEAYQGGKPIVCHRQPAMHHAFGATGDEPSS